MSCFPDTSFLCSLYREQVFSSEADRYFENVEKPASVSTLVCFEFRQSIRLQMRLFQSDRRKGFSRREGDAMLRDFQSDWNAGIWRPVAVDWAGVHQMAELLSAKHTLAGGHRFADILHVATALQLGVRTFLTFDLGQKQLAEAEGLEVPLNFTPADL